MSLEKRKCRRCSTSYLQYRFISVRNSDSQPMCFLCNKVFSNEAMKPSKLSENLRKIHPDTAGKHVTFFQSL